MKKYLFFIVILIFLVSTESAVNAQGPAPPMPDVYSCQKAGATFSSKIPTTIDGDVKSILSARKFVCWCGAVPIDPLEYSVCSQYYLYQIVVFGALLTGGVGVLLRRKNKELARKISSRKRSNS